MSEEVKLRRAKDEDIPFITNSWLKSYRHSPFTAGVGNDAYYAGHHSLIRDLIKDSSVLVLCNPEDDNHILGWGCSEMQVQRQDSNAVTLLHYLYVKHPFRGRGLASKLLAAFTSQGLPVILSHETRAGHKLLAHNHVECTYDPYFALIGIQ